MSSDTTMEEGHSFVSNTDAIIYPTSDYSGWKGDSMISDPNIVLSSTSTDECYQQQIILTAARGGGGSGYLTIVSSTASSSWYMNNNNKQGDRSGRNGLCSAACVETEMEEETKLEVGEASNDSIDPDIALSYIDEKIQVVLGHFQKDFEAGVTHENLGSKFGAYGSFLPMYQRSPSRPYTRTSPEAYRNNISLSPNEGSVASSSAYSAVVPTQKAPAANGKAKLVMPLQDQDFYSKSVRVKKPTKNKLHTRDANENLPTKNNAGICRALGLDVSPSLSLDESQ